MKNIFKFILLTTFALVLTACSSSLNGKYTSKEDDMTMEITEEKNVRIESQTLLGTVEIEGTIDKSKKTMSLTGELWGFKGDSEEAKYTIEDGNIILTMEDETLTFTKEKE